jgi:dipeptidyl aminopeptidase/acylaminoacyl peptidase
VRLTSKAIRAAIAVGILWSAGTSGVLAQEGGWKRPPEPIASLVAAAGTPATSLSPCRRYLLLSFDEAMPSIAVLARPHEKLAGLRIDAPSRGPQWSEETTKLVLRNLADGSEKTVAVPAGQHVGADWNEIGTHLAIARATDAGTELWIVSTADGSARRVEGVRLNNVFRGAVSWLPDQKTLLVKLAAESAPAGLAAAPAGPSTQDSGGGVRAQVRTNPDMLRNEADAERFAHLATSRFAYVDAETLAVAPFGDPALYLGADASPDGSHLLVRRLVRPFSYLVPYSQFPTVVEVWDRAGKLVRKIVETPLLEAVPIGGVPDGVRGVAWLDVPGRRLRWTEARDGGDPKAKVPHRDEIFVLDEPTGAPRSWFKTEHRAAGLLIGEDGRTVLAGETDRDTKRERIWKLDAGDLAVAPKLLYERSTQDAYGDPGRPVMRRMADGRSVFRMKDGALFRTGQGASPTGDRPFLDRWSLADGSAERLWRAAEGRYETFGGFFDDALTKILVRSESPTDPPRDLAVDLKTGATAVLTNFGDPALAYTSKIKKELLTYRREDGVPLSGTLYLPPDAKPGQKYPVFVWAYPLEYAQASDAGQVRAAPTRYVRLRGASHLWLTLAGYAVLDDAAMPIVGAPNSANDTFVRQLKWNAEAAIKALAAHPSCDATRVGVGGHSYGAFMTANLLCHTDVFAAGVARSGAYNRTLTPFGFQNEERTYWEAPEVYHTMSPFSNAPSLNEPILLIHGEDDNNQGTFPIQSQRLFHALKGHGKTARLVMLPHESHGYRARESNEHVLAETIAWLDKFVKNKTPQ